MTRIGCHRFAETRALAVEETHLVYAAARPASIEPVGAVIVDTFNCG